MPDGQPYRALNDKLHLEGKKSIVIYGASGGVGSYALQLSRYFQLDTVIAVCSEHNFEYATSLGATHCLDYRDQQTSHQGEHHSQKSGG